LRAGVLQGKTHGLRGGSSFSQKIFAFANLFRELFLPLAASATGNFYGGVA